MLCPLKTLLLVESAWQSNKSTLRNISKTRGEMSSESLHTQNEKKVLKKHRSKSVGWIPTLMKIERHGEELRC